MRSEAKELDKGMGSLGVSPTSVRGNPFFYSNMGWVRRLGPCITEVDSIPSPEGMEPEASTFASIVGGHLLGWVRLLELVSWLGYNIFPPCIVHPVLIFQLGLLLSSDMLPSD